MTLAPSDNSSDYLALGLASSCPSWMSLLELNWETRGLLPGLGSFCSSVVGGEVLFCSSDVVYQILAEASP
ncbi:hypothetical protein Pyn_05356 [Prunus yedoensis var. nudiflora]|uniref:Uncharacterized protein n=1 Tax=Prunus yedoensis var. nudiflora TaxID=2094558 RepID=A0A314ZJV6_PRUYE|nr:hypothetical protein Pyn_05356 [Prunus yedoensis var. nudiflora]